MWLPKPEIVISVTIEIYYDIHDDLVDMITSSGKSTVYDHGISK